MESQHSHAQTIDAGNILHHRRDGCLYVFHRASLPNRKQRFEIKMSGTPVLQRVFFFSQSLVDGGEPLRN